MGRNSGAADVPVWRPRQRILAKRMSCTEQGAGKRGGASVKAPRRLVPLAQRACGGLGGAGPGTRRAHEASERRHSRPSHWQAWGLETALLIFCPDTAPGLRTILAPRKQIWRLRTRSQAFVGRFCARLCLECFRRTESSNNLPSHPLCRRGNS